MIELPDKPWARPPEELLEALDTSREGLSGGEAQRRQEHFGANKLREIQRRSWRAILIEQLNDVVVLLLVAAGVASLAYQQWADAIAIGVVVLVNTVVGFVTELRAARSIESLEAYEPVSATVRRDDRAQQVDAEDLVPGDIVLLEDGMLVPADCRLLEVDSLEADEAALTGESTAVEKQVEPVEDVPLAERSSMVFKGATIATGSAWAVVVATGEDTEVGEVSQLMREAETREVPLDERLDALGKKLVWLTLGVAALVSLSGIAAGRDLVMMIETGIALAVAAIPEGLAIVATLALAKGMSRMLDRNALVRRLSSVETLGSTNVILTDKTGTLTEERMEVEVLDAVEKCFDLAGDGLDRDCDDETLQEILKTSILANDIDFSEGREQGDPVELALLRLGDRFGYEYSSLLETFPRIDVEPFDRDQQMMAALHECERDYMVAAKGAPEAILNRSTGLGLDGDELDEQVRSCWLERADELASQGLRVLALARRVTRERPDPFDEELDFIGLVGFLDPPREGVADAISVCRKAGIHVVMVTGDHPETASYIANQTGIVAAEDSRVITGRELDNADEWDEEFRAETRVFARVSPKQKLELVRSHQKGGRVVAMTGDGVNDAPALERADIGVAMGERGTDVAREAADMVLLDDAFETIELAIEQGRNIFDNIRRFVVYLLSGNVGEIFAVAAAATAGAPLPLLPLQILYLNMVNDVLPALAISVGPGTSEVMNRPPRDPNESTINRRQWGEIVGYGLIVAATLLGVLWYALEIAHFDETTAVTLSFLTLSVSRLLHAFNMRAADENFFVNSSTRNPHLWAALALSLGLLIAAVYIDPLAEVLSLEALEPAQWAVVGLASLVPLLTGQIYLGIRRYLMD
jgi:Ca2+-transporting ATPase